MATATGTTTTEQVAIDMENMNNSNNQMDSLTAGVVSVDGPHRSSGHRRHNSNGSGHRNDSDAEESRSRHNNRRQHRERRRSRSHSHSPSRRKRDTDVGTPSTEKDITTNSHDVEPLLVTDVHRKVKQSELDDDSDDNVEQHEQNPGVDDGFFVGERKPSNGDADEKRTTTVNTTNHHNGPELPFPYAPGYAPGFNPGVIMDAQGNPQVIPDINVYQQKKNLAQGMMDLALLSANANQLRYVLETYVRHPYYWFSLISITISLILQVAVGVGLILNSRYNIKNREQICRADKINNFTIIGIFLITAVNVFIAAFGVADPPISA